MPLMGTQGYGGAAEWPEQKAAREYVQECGGLTEQGDNEPCYRELCAAVPAGSDASLVVRSSIEVGTGNTEWRGRDSGHYSLSIRRCGRTACNYQAVATVAEDHTLMGISDRAISLGPDARVCIADQAQG